MISGSSFFASVFCSVISVTVCVILLYYLCLNLPLHYGFFLARLAEICYSFRKKWFDLGKIWWFELCCLEISFQFFVEGKGLWGYIDGTEIRPDESESKKFKQWRFDNAKIISWILGSIDANIGIPIRGFKTAAEMWNYLERVRSTIKLAGKF